MTEKRAAHGPHRAGRTKTEPEWADRATAQEVAARRGAAGQKNGRAARSGTGTDVPGRPRKEGRGTGAAPGRGDGRGTGGPDARLRRERREGRREARNRARNPKRRSLTVPEPEERPAPVQWTGTGPETKKGAGRIVRPPKAAITCSPASAVPSA